MDEHEQGSTETLGRPAAGAFPPLPLLARGAAVGRYVILHPIGQGGMGVVYAGYDPELDRKVALKLLRPDRAGGEAARLRLLREAQAIARLSHPNVVSVYDAGSFGDQVFIAMELVPGRTLREWLDEGRRSWREVAALFLEAGRGLAAAHAAGLVHRDFKPENVLLGHDGRVRVVDFGLARPAGIEAGGEAGESPAGVLASPLTDHGVVLGTPAYMAPEQLRGGPADARSDQYGFCVALWEALYGERPSASSGPPESPSRGPRVPPWLRQALVRGLSADPADRHPTMDSLLAVLSRDPWLLRRRALAAAAAVLLVGAAGFGWYRSRQALCGGGEERTAALWNAPRRQAVHAAFTATRAGYAEATWTAVDRTLDRYFSGWAAAHREACEATRIRGEQSEELLDRRMACLDQNFRQAGALVDLFTHADAGLVRNAVNMSAKLQALDDECSDAAALLAPAPRPKDAAARARIAAAEEKLARDQVLSDAGRDEAAARDLEGVVAEARAVAFRPLEAKALYLRGYAQSMLGRSHEAEATLFDAILAAQAGGDRETIGLAASQLARAVGLDQGRREEAHRWIRLSQSSVEGIRGAGVVKVKLLNGLAVVLQSDALYKEEEATYRQALALSERATGDSALTATVLSNLAVALNLQGRDAESAQTSLRGLAIRRRVLAPGHPDLARSYNTLGNAYSNLGRKDEALAMYREARNVFAATYGEGHPLTASADGNIGIVLKDLKRYDEALQYYRRCLAAFEANEPDGPSVAMALSNLAELLTIEKRYAEALPQYRRALAIDLKLLGPSHPDLAYDLKGVAEALAGLGRTRDAISYFERALAIRESAQATAEQVADSRYSLALALWTAGDRGRALRLARQAYAGYSTASGGNTKEMAAEVRGWLRERGETP